MEQPIFIHILSDFDRQSPEYSIYNALLCKHFPNLRILSSNQKFKKGDMMAPGIFLRLIYPDFPDNTIHICTLHTDSRLPEKFILVKANNQYFLGPDNGFLPIALEKANPEYYKLPNPQRGGDVVRHSFIPALQQLLVNWNTISFETEERPRKYLIPAPTISGNIWRLMVLYNDSQGNAYLNLDKDEFDRVAHGKNVTIKLGLRDSIEGISTSYQDVQEGNKLALFGLGNLLQIAINCGSAEQYLGLKHGSMVMMEIQ